MTPSFMHYPAPSGGGGLSPETGATRHWVFGSDYAGLTDLVASAALTPNNTPAHTLGANYLEMPADRFYALNSDYNESVNQTIIIVANRLSDTNDFISHGTYDGSSNGSNAFTQFGTQFRHLTRNQLLNLTNVASIDTRFFSFTNAGNTQRAGVGTGASVSITNRDNGAPLILHSPARTVAIGNAYWAAAGTVYNKAWRIYEAIFFNTNKSDVEVGTIYTNSKARLAARGVTVV